MKCTKFGEKQGILDKSPSEAAEGENPSIVIYQVLEEDSIMFYVREFFFTLLLACLLGINIHISENELVLKVLYE